MKWFTSMKELKGFPDEFEAKDSEELIAQVKAKYPNRSFEFEDFSDELAIYFRSPNGKRRKFANLQFNG